MLSLSMALKQGAVWHDLHKTSAEMMNNVLTYRSEPADYLHAFVDVDEEQEARAVGCGGCRTGSHSPAGLTSRRLLSHNSGGWTCKIKVLADSAPG